MMIAAMSNNVDGIRLLHAGGGDSLAQDFFEVSALVSAAGVGSWAAMDKLQTHAQHPAQGAFLRSSQITESQLSLSSL